MKAETKLLSVDLGFSNTKWCSSNDMGKYKSTVGHGRELSLQNLCINNCENDHIQCTINDNKYFVSDLAIRECDTLINSLQDNRFDLESTRALLHVALAQSLGSGVHNVSIVSGLPVTHYSKFKDSLTELIEDKHYIDTRLNGNIVRGTVTIDKSLIIPQPFGALTYELLDEQGSIFNKSLVTGVVAVIDIGFGTTDVYVVENLQPIERYSFSSKTAISTLYGYVKSNIKFTGNIYSLQGVIESKVYKQGNKKYSIQDIISWASGVTAEALVSEISNCWKDLYVDTVIISGGGSHMLGSYLLPHFNNPVLSNNGQMSVAVGYYKWGKFSWKDVI